LFVLIRKLLRSPRPQLASKVPGGPKLAARLRKAGDRGRRDPCQPALPGALYTMDFGASFR
jgi:hypothetical protein